MEVEGVPLDDKAKRMRDLLSSFYSTDHSSASLPPHTTSRFATLDTIDTSSFDADQYMNLLIVSVQSRSDGFNTSLYEKREHIEKLRRTRNLLRKLQFIYDLPSRLEKCIKAEAYSDAVKFYTGAMPIFKAYGDSSFQDCKQASEKVVTAVIKNLQGKVFSDSESIQARAEAVILLKQLDFPVETLKVKLFEKLEQFLVDLHLETEELENDCLGVNSSSYQGSTPDSSSATAHEVMKGYKIS